MTSSETPTPAPAAGSPATDAVAAAPAAPAAPVARSIGERLRAGRERAGLSIAAAAEKLHLDPKVIEALEADRFAEIGASVYVRGHLRRYGDFVGENGTELVSMYGLRETRAAAPDLTQVPHPERRADPRRLVTPLVVLASAAVLLAAIWWVLSGSRSIGGGAPASTSTAPATAAVDAAEVSVPPAPVPDVTATPATLGNSAAPTASAAVPTSSSATAPASSAPAVPAAKESPAREIRLRLELTNDSWVEVYDSSGQRLFYDVATGGSVQSVSGRGPLRVVLENAAGVTVEVDGQSREIPAGAIDGERARFVVNRSGTLTRSR
jgi:cytoskeleton protein RodZ